MSATFSSKTASRFDRNAASIDCAFIVGFHVSASRFTVQYTRSLCENIMAGCMWEEGPDLSEEELSKDEPDSPGGPRISIVGIGGAGNRLLTNVIGNEAATAERCVAVNTDRAQLSRSRAHNKVLLGEDIVDGRGAMGSVLLGKRALQLSAHRITSFVDASDMTIILVGFGGGTGTAAAPIIAQWARSQVKPVVAVVALPFTHERERRFVALRGLKRMSEACDCTIVVDNATSSPDSDQGPGRSADATAVVTVRRISGALSSLEPAVMKNIMRVMTLGSLAVACVRNVEPEGNLTSAVIASIRSPSSELPLSRARGAVLLHTGPVSLGPGQANHIYETVSSLVGHEISFAYGSVVSTDSQLCLLLTGYHYDSSIGGFVELLTDLYDVEYGQREGRLVSPLWLPLYQLEGS